MARGEAAPAVKAEESGRLPLSDRWEASARNGHSARHESFQVTPQAPATESLMRGQSGVVDERSIRGHLEAAETVS